MRKYVVCLCGALVAVAALRVAFAGEGSTAPRALMVTGAGAACEAATTSATAHGWTVGTMDWDQLREVSVEELRSQWDVIWISPGVEYQALRRVSKADGPLETFAEAGGVVVMLGLSGTKRLIDVAPGGVDFAHMATPGPTAITDANHPLIVEAPAGGNALTAQDLDPNSTGGGGYLVNHPGGCPMNCIANNGTGSIFAEYQHGEGHILVSLLDLSGEACINNVLAYAKHLIHSN